MLTWKDLCDRPERPALDPEHALLLVNHFVSDFGPEDVEGDVSSLRRLVTRMREFEVPVVQWRAADGEAVLPLGAGGYLCPEEQDVVVRGTVSVAKACAVVTGLLESRQRSQLVVVGHAGGLGPLLEVLAAVDVPPQVFLCADGSAIASGVGVTSAGQLLDELRSHRAARPGSPAVVQRSQA